MELNGPTKGKWQWSGWFSPTRSRHPSSPNNGHCDTARIANEMVESFYARCLRDMKPRQYSLGPEEGYRRFAHIPKI